MELFFDYYYFFIFYFFFYYFFFYFFFLPEVAELLVAERSRINTFQLQQRNYTN